MCKNADNPCPGCKKHKKADAKWMFFSKEERLELERLVKADNVPALVSAQV